MSGTGDMHDRGTPQHWQSVIDRLNADGDWEAAAALWDAKRAATLTDAEREAVERAIATLDGWQATGGYHSAIADDAATLRAILERTK